MLLVVPSSADEPSYVPTLEAAGFKLRIRETEWFEHRLFNGPDTDIGLHVFSAGTPEIDRILRFRDRLWVSQADRAHYERTKRQLANTCGDTCSTTPTLKPLPSRRSWTGPTRLSSALTMSTVVDVSRQHASSVQRRRAPTPTRPSSSSAA